MYLSSLLCVKHDHRLGCVECTSEGSIVFGIKIPPFTLVVPLLNMDNLTPCRELHDQQGLVTNELKSQVCEDVIRVGRRT